MLCIMNCLPPSLRICCLRLPQQTPRLTSVTSACPRWRTRECCLPLVGPPLTWVSSRVPISSSHLLRREGRNVLHGQSLVSFEYDAMAWRCFPVLFSAPELLQQKSYGKEVDLWALGVITYILYVLSWDPTCVFYSITVSGWLRFNPERHERLDTLCMVLLILYTLVCCGVI